MNRIVGEPPQPPPERKQTCSWCGVFNVVAWGRNNWCGSCGHRADVPRSACDCAKCLALRAAASADRAIHHTVRPVDALLEEMAERSLLESAALLAMQALVSRHDIDLLPQKIAGQAVAIARALVDELANAGTENDGA